MVAMIEILLYVLLLLVCLAAIGLNVLSLPGNWVMLALSLGWFWYRGWDNWGVLALGVMLGVLLAGEMVELLGSMVGARKFGASKSASWAAIGGAMIGALMGFAIPIPVVGNLIGAIAGAFIAAWLVELIQQRPIGPATKAAVGAALGRGVGIMAKIGCGMLAWLFLAFFGFP
jgi:uncharacterized protein